MNGIAVLTFLVALVCSLNARLLCSTHEDEDAHMHVTLSTVKKKIKKSMYRDEMKQDYELVSVKNTYQNKHTVIEFNF